MAIPSPTIPSASNAVSAVRLNPTQNNKTFYCFSGEITVDTNETTIISVKTEKGLMGTIIQDVVTNPPVKKLRVQGEEDYIEWEVTETADFVRCLDDTKIFNKRRSDDFVGEIDYIQDVLERKVNSNSLTLESGLDVMMVIAAARLSNDIGSGKCIINYDEGYSLNSIGVN